MQARSQPSGNGGSFSSDFAPFQGLKIGVPSWYLGKTSILKIMIDAVTLWSKLESFYMVNLLDFINYILKAGDIQDVSAWTLGGKVTF